MLHAHIHTLVIMAPFVLLLVFTATYASVTSERNLILARCGTIIITKENASVDSKCMVLFFADDKVYLRVDYAMGLYQNSVIAIALSRYAYHDYSTIHQRVYFSIPKNISQQDLNRLMCKNSNHA